MRESKFTDPKKLRADFFKSHSKGFHEFIVSSNTPSPKLGESVVYWYAISSGKRTTLFKFLFLKWLWDELTSQEFLFLLNLPEFFSSKEFQPCLAAVARGVPKRTIRVRLNNFRKLQGLKPWSQEMYKSMKSLRYVLGEVVLGTQPAKKFSGWVRHHKDHGSLRGVLVEPTPSIFTESVEFDLFMILSVGKVNILGKEFGLSPEDDSKESKRKWSINKLTS